MSTAHRTLESAPRAVNDVASTAVQWTVMAPPDLAEHAQWLRAQGATLRCVCCRRVGQVMRVVVERADPDIARGWRELRQRRDARRQP